MSMFSLFEWINETQLSIAVRESVWVFPILLSIHALGTSLSAGTVAWFDLRLLGVKLTQQTVSEVYRQIAPWMIGGFAIMFISGGLLFWASPVSLYEDAFFWIKAGALVLGSVNAAVYHLTIRRTISRWDTAPVPPRLVRMSGIASLLAWTSAIVFGRLIFS